MILVGNEANQDLQQQVPKEEALVFDQENCIPLHRGYCLNMDEYFHKVIRALWRFQGLENPPIHTVHPSK
ncbi:hypothetical protein KIL84_006542 [Mauremys mutica]|uniref:Uncharacterized protein n=1 Tax=Mauremys mutica TaxID=74926 RepID=A0A9D4AUM9_9SAUR|nr:hypothetical protein KIL84_006542 [Mauremys mutica]